jgi:hypothetical protein
MSVPYDDLDPGIRQVVRWLNDNDFTTHDSGDGKTKFQEDGETPLPDWATGDEGYDCVMPFPHVIMSVAVDVMGPECVRLRDLLLERGLPVGVQGPDDDISIQGSFDPCLEKHPAYVMLFGLDDVRLIGSSATEPPRP